MIPNGFRIQQPFLRKTFKFPQNVVPLLRKSPPPLILPILLPKHTTYLLMTPLLPKHTTPSRDSFASAYNVPSLWSTLLPRFSGQEHLNLFKLGHLLWEALIPPHTPGTRYDRLL